MGRRPIVRAAGGVLWRSEAGRVEVALVHRPRYDDWSLPKGKRKAGEHLLLTAAREVTEETGYEPVLGAFIAQYSYVVGGDGKAATKTVKYWAMEAVAGRFAPSAEVDEMAWLSVPAALATVSRAVDRKVLEAFTELPPALATLILIRNGSVAVRSRTPRSDRSLDRRGQAQAEALVPVLGSFGVKRLASSAAPRCTQTLLPYAEAVRATVETESVLDLTSERRAEEVTDRVLDLCSDRTPIAVCLEGAVVTPVLHSLQVRCGTRPRSAGRFRRGGWTVLQISEGRLRSIERPWPAA